MYLVLLCILFFLVPCVQSTIHAEASVKKPTTLKTQQIIKPVTNVPITESLEKTANTEIPIDRTRAVIFGANKTIVITQADLERQSVTGTPRTLENLVFENSVMLQAQELKFNMPTDAVEKHIENIQKKHDMTPDQFEQMLQESHYTFDLFKEELQRAQIVGNMLEFKVYSKAIVPYQEIVDFYQANPIYTEPTYHITYTTVPKTRSKKQLEKIIHENEPEAFKWQDPFWIAESEIAHDKNFIISMPANSMYITEEPQHYMIYRVIEKCESQLVSLEDRYHEITAILREPLAEKLFNEYSKYIKDHTTILDFD